MRLGPAFRSPPSNSIMRAVGWIPPRIAVVIPDGHGRKSPQGRRSRGAHAKTAAHGTPCPMAQVDSRRRPASLVCAPLCMGDSTTRAGDRPAAPPPPVFGGEGCRKVGGQCRRRGRRRGRSARHPRSHRLRPNPDGASGASSDSSRSPTAASLDDGSQRPGDPMHGCETRGVSVGQPGERMSRPSQSTNPDASTSEPSNVVLMATLQPMCLSRRRTIRQSRDEADNGAAPRAWREDGAAHDDHGALLRDGGGTTRPAARGMREQRRRGHQQEVRRACAPIGEDQAEARKKFENGRAAAQNKPENDVAKRVDMLEKVQVAATNAAATA